MKALLFLLVVILLSLPGAGDAQEGPRRVAVFDVELWDTSGEGERPEQTARLAMLGALLRDQMAERGDCALVDLGPVRPEIEARRPLFRCGGCQLEIARKAGAGYALNVIVRKMSTLVQEITLILADVEHDEVIAFHSVSIRNNSDDAWRRGLRYILEHRLPESDAFGGAAIPARRCRERSGPAPWPGAGRPVRETPQGALRPARSERRQAMADLHRRMADMSRDGSRRVVQISETG